jgi:oligosaccharide repeat unit polymerase
MFFIFLYSLIIGEIIGLKTKSFKIRRKKINIDKMLLFYLIYSFLGIFYEWFLMISNYGDISYIFTHANVIRVENIGQNQSLIPLWLSYSLSFIYACFCISLMLFEIKKKKIYIFYCSSFFLLIALTDLITFGRIGMIYAMFCLIGYNLIFNKFKINAINIIFLSILFYITSLPRLIRGSFDNFSATIERVIPFANFSIPSVFYSLISIYIYYFSSLYALTYYIDNNSSLSLTFGAHTITPLFNLYNRIFSNSYNRFVLIQEVAYIPFETNIYSIIYDLFVDFEVIGLFLFPILFGFILGKIFNSKRKILISLQFFLIGWILYTPVYNAFSFGGFFLSFCFLFFLCFFYDIK